MTVTKPEEREQSVLFYHGEVNGDDGEGVEDIGEENEEDLNNEIEDSAMESDLEREFEVSYVLKKLLPLKEKIVHLQSDCL